MSVSVIGSPDIIAATDRLIPCVIPKVLSKAERTPLVNALVGPPIKYPLAAAAAVCGDMMFSDNVPPLNPGKSSGATSGDQSCWPTNSGWAWNSPLAYMRSFPSSEMPASGKVSPPPHRAIGSLYMASRLRKFFSTDPGRPDPAGLGPSAVRLATAQPESILYLYFFG